MIGDRGYILINALRSYRFETKRGKGSHGTLYYGSRKTILKDRKKEIGQGLLSKILA